MAGAGAGYDPADIRTKIAAMARAACAYKAEAADMRAWFDRISQGTDQEAADALVAVSGMTAAEALKTIQAMREFTFWAATFVPTHTLDVRGASSLI